MDILSLDPEVLEMTATIIEGYCKRQESIMDDYLSSTSALSYEWTDDKTMGTLLEEIKMLKDGVVSIMEEINGTYPKFFRAKAKQILERPEYK